MNILNDQTTAAPGLVQNLLTDFKEKHILPQMKESLAFDCCDEQTRENFVRQLLQPVHNKIIGKESTHISETAFETDVECVKIIKGCALFEKNNSL